MSNELPNLERGIFTIGDELAMEPDDWLDQLLASGALVEIPSGRLVDREAINQEAAMEIYAEHQYGGQHHKEYADDCHSCRATVGRMFVAALGDTE